MSDQSIGDHHINELIASAVESSGMIYGAYVRNVIYPISVGKDPVSLDEGTQELNIWFTDNDDATSFIKSRGDQLCECQEQTGVNHINKQISKRFMFNNGNNTKIVHISVIISRQSPVRDFDINHLCYCGPSFEEPNWYVHGYTRNSSPDPLLQLMATKTTMMLSRAVAVLSGSGTWEHSVEYQQLAELLEQSWTVQIPNISPVLIKVIDKVLNKLGAFGELVGKSYQITKKTYGQSEVHVELSVSEISLKEKPGVYSVTIEHAPSEGRVIGEDSGSYLSETKQSVGQQILNQVAGLSHKQVLLIADICGISYSDI